jgi:hypothetical protein
MLRGLTAREFAEWRAYADLEPFDETRADLRAASIVSAYLNTHRRKGQPPYKLEHCLLRFGSEAAPKARTPQQARAEVRRTMDMLMLIFNDQPKTTTPRAKRETR